MTWETYTGEKQTHNVDAILLRNQFEHNEEKDNGNNQHTEQQFHVMASWYKDQMQYKIEWGEKFPT